MQHRNPVPHLSGWRQAPWLAFLVAVSVAFTLGFACAMPFAALGAAAALTLPRRDALLLTGAAWIANQFVGFAVLGYPGTAGTIVWGLVLGGVAMLTTVAAQEVVARLGERGVVTVALASFVGAFATYEVALFLVSATVMGGTEDFMPAIVARILGLNAVAFLGFIALNRLAAAGGLIASPVLSAAPAHRVG